MNGFTGIAAGNFDGSPGNEIVLSNDNGRIYVYRYNGTNLIADNINTGNNFINANLAGITVGNFDGNAGDEIATINNSANGNIEMTVYSLANSTLTQLSIFTLATGNYSQWNGITSGDFDGDGIDEIIAHRNYDGDFFIFKLDAHANVVNNYKESFPVNQQNGVIGAARFSIDPGKDALISLRNYDGNMFIYNLEGLCPGLHLDNVTVNDAYTIDNPYSLVNNNYNVDYHVQNTLTASNYVIESGSNVTFTSGNEIILLPGFVANAGSDFHAYIDEVNLGCGTHSTFRIADNNSNAASSTADILKPQNELPVSVFDFSISPNPNSGLFQVTFSSFAMRTDIYVYDLMGNLILQKQNVSDDKVDIDLSLEPKGIYLVKGIQDGKVFSKKIVLY